MKRLPFLFLAAISAISAIASVASAQAIVQPAPFTGANTNGGPPPVSFIKFGARGDTLQSDQRGDYPIDDLAIQPIRLSLSNEFVPHFTNDPVCSGSPEASGSLTGMRSFPAQQTLGMHVFQSPRMRLSLFGMSRLGCQLDAFAGGGATASIQLQKNTFFVLSGGAIFLPHGGTNGQPTSSGTHVRADIVFAREGGRSYTMGVGVVRGSPRVSVGGVF